MVVSLSVQLSIYVSAFLDCSFCSLSCCSLSASQRCQAKLISSFALRNVTSWQLSPSLPPHSLPRLPLFVTFLCLCLPFFSSIYLSPYDSFLCGNSPYFVWGSVAQSDEMSKVRGQKNNKEQKERHSRCSDKCCVIPICVALICY